MMTIDWQYIRDFETRFEKLISKLSEQYWLLLNNGQKQDIASTETDLNKLFSDHNLKSFVEVVSSQVNDVTDAKDRRILELFQRVVYTETLARSPLIVPLKNHIRQESLEYQAEIDGKKYSTSEMVVILRESKDRDLREKAYHSLHKLVHVLEPKFKEIWDIYNRYAEAHGFDNYSQFQCHNMEIDANQLKTYMDEFYKLVQPIKEKVMKQFHTWTEECGIQGNDLEPWDVQYIMYNTNNELKPYFPSYKAVDVLLSTYRNLGFPVDRFPIIIDTDHKPQKKESFAFCSSISIPNDIRLSVSPYDSTSFYRILFHEYGHALHFASIMEKDVLLKISNTPALNEMMSLFSEMVMCDSEWSKRFIHLDYTLDRKFFLINRIQSLLWVYSVLAGVQFELKIYDNPGCDLKSLRREINKKYSFFQFDHEFCLGEGEFIVFMESPFYLAGYFMANIHAVQVYNHLCTENSIFKNDPSHVGNFITKHFYKFGNYFPWHELTRRAFGKPPSIKLFVKYFEIP